MAPQLLPTVQGDSLCNNKQESGQGEQADGQQQQQQQQQPADEGDLLERLDAFMAVQRERAIAYRSFDAAFRAYLQSGAEAPYRQAMGQLTAQFQGCSLRVRAMEAALQTSGQLEAAALLRVVQENEREKLRLTLSLQALKAAYQQERFRRVCQRAHPPFMLKRIGHLPGQLSTASQSITRRAMRALINLRFGCFAPALDLRSWQLEEGAAAEGPDAPSLAPELPQGHVCGLGCAHEAPPEEPTEAEYTGAVRESYQLLQVAITAINDALEELAQQRQDLLEA